MTDTPSPSDAQAIIDVLRDELSAERVFDESDKRGPVIVDHARGRLLEDLTPVLDKYAPQPRFRTGTSVHESIASLIDHARRFRDEGSAGFVSPKEGEVVVVLDHDLEGGPDAGNQRRRAHRAAWKPLYHEDWLRWTDRERHGQWLDPLAFAEHLEDGAGELLPRPDPVAGEDAKLRDLAARMRLTFGDPDQIVGLARDFKIHVDSEVQAIHTLQSGEAALTFREGHHDGAGEKIQVPGAFVVGLHVFDGDPAVYRAMAKLRYRKNGGTVKWRYEIHNLPDIKRAAWNGVADQLAQGVADDDDHFPVFLGTPERPA